MSEEKRYGVTLPIKGYVYLELKATSEKHAIELAFQKEVTVKDIEEWETVQKGGEADEAFAEELEPN